MRFARLSLITLGGVAGIAIAAVFAISEWKLRRQYEAPLVPLRTSLPPDIVEGERMALIVGCWNGCHGPRGDGGTERIEGILRQTAPTLSEVLPLYSDDELVRLIRYGVKHDGRSAVGMTSYTFWALGDQDLANIIAHLRQNQRVVPPRERTLELTWRARIALVTRTWGVAAERVDRTRPRLGDLPQTTRIERGRYVATVTCTECHGLDFEGNELEHAPSLARIAMYSPEQFRHFMRTGKPIGGRDIPKMKWVADTPFTDNEIDGMYEFLRVHHGIRP
jgi:mono/diheme cytochrome c family protein